MSVIPLTLTISLCLVFTFVLFFLREQGRRQFSSAESDALLPLAEETPRPVTSKSAQSRPRAGGDHRHGHHAPGESCGCQRGERPPCDGCAHRRASSRNARN
ncbi:hypothetical protein [Synoicihabitans lomoniglobus]|uniref:Uncharacterized protein n=1 Tax=Synoicihabitans lomoniglobus TaxID=2909285 RepID=A0AAE9ZSP7_9BACT|nr:hypothetical protein [Opitutaceae bacterium LMO-M01]WED63556.1 hypothetical protein PXH66_14560 [Opitutaceae bacterium LMO-M01]